MTRTVLSLPAPAKLNLFLHVIGQRADGYHLLQTLFVLLDQVDMLHFEAADTLLLAGDQPTARPEDNLIHRAAEALRRETGYSGGARILLEKKLPAGGGLGGGSSNAATTLLGLNRLWNLHLDLSELARIGLSLGADVPVFLHGRSAFAEGVGERLTAVKLPARDYLIISPQVHVSTARVFSDRELTRHTPESTVAAFLEPGAEERFRNDCEAVSRRLFPQVDQALRWLENEAGNSRMTGTGGCVFATLRNRREGEKLLSRLPPDWSGFVARSCNISPLHHALGRLRNDDKG